ncbi:MAG: sigma-70 family RNA polymerase sigma factor [Elusimicrobiota bacterium]
MISEPSTWVDAHGDRLFRYALSRIRDERAAEDLIQDVFVVAFKSRDKFKGDSSELTWMIGILRNKIFEHLRKQAREVPLSSPDEDDDREEASFDGRHWSAAAAPRDWGGDPHQKAESAEFSAALRGCLDALTPGVARAFVLREMEGLGHQESAEALGVPPGRLAVLLYRARMRLRRCLERGYFAPEAAR